MPGFVLTYPLRACLVKVRVWFRTLSPMRKPYPTDLSDDEWTRLRSYLPTPEAQGRPRTHSLRDVLDAIFYVLKSGCPWRLLPQDFPAWSSPGVRHLGRRAR